jgi:hypothetical protein
MTGDFLLDDYRPEWDYPDLWKFLKVKEEG